RPAARGIGRGSGWRCRRRWACRPAPQSSGAVRDRTLVRLRPHRLRDAGLPAPQTRLGRLSRAEFGIGEHPHGCPRLLLDLGLTLEILGAGPEAVPGIELHTDAGSREVFLHLAPNP